MSETKTRAEMAANLRKPFPPEEIGKLPRGGIQLDYVGHADVTRRLLESDPDWNWEPLATDDRGLPLFDTGQNGQPVGLWIKLTAGGITRLGYGSCPASQGDAVKVLIGDALRNAAMRFGVALDLWAKGDRADPSAENPAGPAGHRAPRDDSWRDQPPVNRRPQAAPANGNGNGHAAALPIAEPEQADAVTIAAWAARIDEITSQEDADKADAELRGIFTAQKITPATANAIRNAIQAKAASLGGREASAQPSPEVLAWAERIEQAQDIAALRAVNDEVKAARKMSASYMHNGKAITLSQRIGARRAEIEAQMAGAPA